MKKESTIRKWVIGIIGTLVVLVAGILIMKGLTNMKPEDKKRVPVQEEQYVLVKEVKYKTIESSISGSGKLISYSELDVVSEGAGKIEFGNLLIKKGTSFTKGQVLARIYDDEAKLSLQAQKSRFITSLTRSLPDIRIDFPNEFNQIQSFSNSLSTSKKFPELPEITNQKLEAFLSSKMILADYYTIKQMELSVARYTIYAPWSGSIAEVYNGEGAYMNPGGRIMRIIQTDKFEVEVPVELENASWISIGQDVLITSSQRSQTWHGKVSRLANFVDPKTQSRSVFISINNNGSMLNGEYISVSFVGEAIDNVIEIPRNSVINKKFVYTVEKSKLKKVKIDIIKSGEDFSLIRGLNEGDSVVVEPLVAAQEGMSVKTLTAKNK